MSYIPNNNFTSTSIVPKNGNIYFFGDSYTAGTGASTTAKRYSTLVATALGATEINFGIAGSTLQKRVPIDYEGAVNMVDRISQIPTKTVDDKLLIFAFGLNDMGQNGANYTVANYITDYTTVLNNAIGKGWKGNQILLIPPFYIGSAGYATYATISGNAAPTQSHHYSFVEATRTVSVLFNSLFFDIYEDQLNNNTTLITGDTIHPNDAGYAYIAYDILQHLKFSEYSATTQAAVAPIPSNINFQHVTNITNTGTIWNTPSSGGYGNTGLSDTVFTGDQRLIMNGSSFGAVYGLNFSNAQTGYLGMEAAMLLSNTDLYVVDNTSFLGPVATISNSDLISLARVGSVIKIQTSSTNGATWVDVYTFTYSSSATHYIVVDIIGSPTNGHLDTPTISALSASGFIDKAGAIIFSNGFSNIQDGNSLYWDNTNKRLGLGTSVPAVQLHTTSAVRFSNFGIGVATFDSNGNIASLSSETIAFGRTITQSVTAATSITVTLPTTQANSSYKVVAEAKNVLSAVGHWVDSETTTTFVLHFASALTGTVVFNYILIP